MIITKKKENFAINSSLMEKFCESFERSTLKQFELATAVDYSMEYVKCNLNLNSNHLFLKIEENELISLWNSTISNLIWYNFLFT